jgi:hypothetical protein
MQTGIVETVQKRKARRFLFLQRASIEAQGVRQDIEIYNISETGLSFLSNVAIQNNSPISLSWKNHSNDCLIPYGIVVRKSVQTSGNVLSRYKYRYGIKFTNLRNETKKIIQNSMKDSYDQELQACKKLIETNDVDGLVDILRQGRTFLQLLWREPQTHQNISRFTKEIPGYEKSSFENRDDISLAIQKLTTHHFHCLMLYSAVQLVDPTHPKFEMFRATVTEKILTVSALRQELQNLPGTPQLVESKTRLFYSRLDLLKIFVEKYKNRLDKKALQEPSWRSVLDEYNKTFDIYATREIKFK